MKSGWIESSWPYVKLGLQYKKRILISDVATVNLLV